MIYVASSWRNELHSEVVAALQAEAKRTGEDALLPYDFKNPSQAKGFHWTEVGMKSYDRETNGAVPQDEYLEGIEHPRAIDGFNSDFYAMQQSKACVLVLPCGSSAHLEMGWFIGENLLTVILLNDPVVPELMYKMADYLATNLDDLLEFLTEEL